MMLSLGKKTSRTLALVIGAVSVLTTMLLASQAFAISSLSTTVSTTAAVAGGKVDLTTQIPAVSAVDSSTQEIIQNIDSTKVRLTSAADVVAPAGWTVTYSTDGTTFAATPSSWAAVVKVKATGTVNSLGATLDGKQIYSTTTTTPGTVVTANGAIRSGGDGFDTEFDSRGYIYNTYHHNAVNGSLDCRKKSDGSFCSANWPFALSTIGFSSNFSSTQFFDEVNKHLWLPVSDGATGTGFLCVDVTTVETPVLCGGSKATAWHMLNSRVNALATSVIDIVAANGHVYTWDILSPKMLCYNYLANSGMGGPCSVAVPTMSKLVAGSVVASNNIPTTYTNLQVAFGNVYGQLNGVATCFNATTMGLCQGWTAADITLGTTSSNKLMYLQPDASGQIAGVCVTNDALCFAANGTRYAANTTVQAAISNNNISRWRGSTATSGSKLLFTSNWILQSNPSYTYCFDYATNGPCANWPASTAFVTGVGQITTTNSKTYTLKTDPISSDCMWSNGDVFNGFGTGITQFTVSSGTAGCNLNVSTASYTQAQVQTRLTCSVGSDLLFDKFTIGGLTAGVDYSTAKFSILTSSGAAFVSGGTTWSDVAFNASGYVDLSSINPADLGAGYTFKVDYANKTSTSASNGTLTMQSNSAQLCVSVTANKICPTTTLVGTPAQQIFNFSATGATISSANVRIDYNSTSSDLTVAPALAADCGFQLRGQVSEGDKASAYPTTVVPVSGVVATLLNSAGTVLTDANSQPITATTDASGNYSFGYLTAGTYKVRFADFALVNGTGPGDVVMVYIDPFRYQGGSYVMTPQNPPSFTAIQTPLNSLAVTGTAGGADVLVKASYIMRAVAIADSPKIKAGSATTIDVLANDTPTTTDSWTTSSLKLCAAGTTTSCALTSLPVSGQGTYSVSSGKIVFTPLGGFTGAVTPATYQISDSFSNTPQTVTALLSPTVLAAPTTSPDTLSGNLLAPITVDVTANDVAASGTTLDKSSVKLCATGTTTACALTSVTVTGKGVFSVNALGVVTFTPDAAFVGAVPALTYSITDGVGNVSTNTITATATATPPVITTSALPNAARGVVMPTDLQTVIAGTAAIPATGAWTLLSGSLPNGLSLNANTGAISGTPTASGTFNFTVKVTDANGLTGTQAQSITVFDGPTITTTPLTQKIYSGAAFTSTNTATAGTGALRATGAWSATDLPAGLSIDGTTGVISGTPTTSGNYPVVVRVTDVNGLFDEETITINVVAKPAITTTSPLAPAVLGVAITPIAQTKTDGSNSIPATGAWAITSGVLPAGLSFNVNTGEITGTPTQTGVFPFTVTLTDSIGEIGTKAESITVNSGPTVTTTPTTQKIYTGASFTLANTATAGTGAIRTTGAWSATGLPAGLTIDGTTGVISGTPTATGNFSVVVRVTDVNSLFDQEIITLNVVAKPAITTTSPLTPAVLGVAITPIGQTKTVGNNAIPATGAWSITSGVLPAGLSFNPDTGEITGTPTQTGVFPFTVTLTDSGGEVGTKAESITVNSGPTVTTTPTTIQAWVNEAKTINNTATIGTGAIRAATGWSATGLPNGLSINGTSGVITGTPTVAGSYTVTLRATDINGLFDEETLTINVGTKAVITTPTPLTTAVVGVAIAPITQTNTTGTSPIPATGAWSIVSGALPAGLSFNPDTGTITGTPTTGGNFTFTVKLTESSGEFSTKVETMTVNSPPAITTAPLSYTIFTGSSSTIANTATQGTGAIRTTGAWSATGLPAGLTIDGTTGTISGTPASVGVSSVVVRVTDVNGLFDEETLNIEVTPPVSPPTVTTSPASYKFGVNNNIAQILDSFFAASTKFAQSREIVNTATQGTAAIATTGAWSATGLPPGLTINADTGKISGAGTQVGTFSTVVKVTDSAGRFATKTLSIEITQGPTNTTKRDYTYEVDIPKGVGVKPVTIDQTWTLGSAALNSNGRPVPFLVQGQKPGPVTSVSIVSGQIEVIPSLSGVGKYTLKTVIVDANGAYDIATFTFNIVKAGTNVTTLTLPPTITDGMLMNATLHTLTGTSSKKLPVSYTVSTPKVCTIDGATKKLKLVNKGTCTVTAASGSGALLSKDTKSFVITKLPQAASVVAPGATVPGTSTVAPAPTDDPLGFQLYGAIDTGAAPVYTSLDPNVCSVDAGGVVTWDADLTALPRVEADFHCRVSVSHPGDLTHDAAPAQTITLNAVHVETPAPEGGIAKETTQVASIPATGGKTPMKGGNSFAVTVDSKKKTVSLQPISRGRYIGPIYADIKISWTPAATGVEEVQICARSFFGIAAVDAKTKKVITPALGGDMMKLPEAAKNSKEVSAVVKPYQAMQGMYGKTTTVKGKKVYAAGYLDFKDFKGQATCVLNAKAYAAWKAGVKIKANATVTRDRRWPASYTRYKSYNWKKKSFNGLLYPTVVEWVINIG